MLALAQNRQYVSSYVDLRNQYVRELATEVITVDSTIEWMNYGQGDIFCEVENGIVVATVIVYETQEVAVFSSRPLRGDKLLAEAEVVARSKGYDYLWAWTIPENERARKMFRRNGYIEREDGSFKKGVYCFRNGSDKFPLMVVLSFTYVCNARCPNCPYNNSSIRDTYKDALWMQPELFKKIADECGSHGAVLRLSGGGEPFLHKDIVELAKYATDKGCKVSIITNGSKSVLGLIDVVDMIEFSVDAGNEEDYRRGRPGLDWFLLNRHVIDAIEKRTKTIVIVSAINQVDIDIDAVKNHWSHIGVAAVQIRKYLTWGYNQDKSADLKPYLAPEKRIPCPWLFERLNIDSRGDVTYCGEDIAFEHKFANVNDRSIQEIWTGSEFTILRNKHLARQGHPAMCLDCSDWKYRTWDYNYWRLRADASINLTA